MAQVTNTREKTCCRVTWTLDLTSPLAACRISSTAPVWNIWKRNNHQTSGHWPPCVLAPGPASDLVALPLATPVLLPSEKFRYQL